VVVMRRPPSVDSDGGADDRQSTRLAIRRAAIELFERDGYDRTSLDAIMEYAGIARRTFFNHFSGKHEIISCDHQIYLAEVSAYLGRYASDPTISRAATALSLVLDSFLVAPAESRSRYSLARATPVVRAEELSWGARYESVVAAFLVTESTTDAAMRATIAAAALVSALAKSLRRWLRDVPGADPMDEFSRASDLVDSWYRHGTDHVNRIVVIDTDLEVEDIIRRLDTSEG
jgi:AcrR family transcriptional regulator